MKILFLKRELVAVCWPLRCAESQIRGARPARACLRPLQHARLNREDKTDLMHCLPPHISTASCRGLPARAGLPGGLLGGRSRAPCTPSPGHRTAAQSLRIRSSPSGSDSVYRQRGCVSFTVQATWAQPGWPRTAHSHRCPSRAAPAGLWVLPTRSPQGCGNMGSRADSGWRRASPAGAAVEATRDTAGL